MNDLDPIDELLTRSAPHTVAPTPELREELTRMAVTSAHELRAPGPRRLRVAATAGIATVALLAGAGAAAATGAIGWGPWAQDPDVSFAYVLPSGEACELRLTFDDRETGEVAREIAAQLDLATEIDVAGEIIRLRAMPSTGGDEFGNSWDTGYGTEFYPEPDAEYDTAVAHAVSGLLGEELSIRGVAPAAQDATSGSTCAIERAQ